MLDLVEEILPRLVCRWSWLRDNQDGAIVYDTIASRSPPSIGVGQQQQRSSTNCWRRELFTLRKEAEAVWVLLLALHRIQAAVPAAVPGGHQPWHQALQTAMLQANSPFMQTPLGVRDFAGQLRMARQDANACNPNHWPEAIQSWNQVQIHPVVHMPVTPVWRDLIAATGRVFREKWAEIRPGRPEGDELSWHMPSVYKYK